MKLHTLFTKAFFLFGFANFSLGQTGNVTNGGQIGYNLTIYSGPQAEPDTLFSIEDASGGDSTLSLQYLWYKSNSGFNDFEIASGVNNQSFYILPSDLNQTTFFLRKARRANFTVFQAGSNTLAVTVVSGNIDDGGLIGSDQTIMINEQPDTLFEIEPATGGNPTLDLEYEWVKRIPPSTTEEPADGVIDQPYYIPLPLTETTVFKRKTRRVGFMGYAYSNQVVVEVEPTSIENLEEGIIQIYPNPTTNYLQIEFMENSSSNWQVDIFDIKGSLQKTISLENVNSVETINLQDLAKGTYLIQMTDLENNKGKHFKILKK